MLQVAIPKPQKPLRIPLWLAVLLIMNCIMPALSHGQQPLPARKTDDIRVIIDISGSMKRTDPQNLRAPALRLFSSLLPSGTQAGVWTFGQWVNMLVRHGPVDQNWKTDALAKTGAISSVGLFTNIEEALVQATADWTGENPDFNRCVILLTDGLVDISEDEFANAESRRRIVEEILPRLEAMNVKLHTIALSSESDRDLLQQLATASGGWFETIETTDGLERLFLRLFEKVAQADSVPLTNNLIKIDPSIKEVTFLLFRKNELDAISLTSPAQTQVDKNHLLDGMQWHQEARYDLITISNPQTGNWKINADLDPDNRAMVVTDLKLRTTELPNALLSGSTFTINAQLEESGKIIERKEFLKFVRMSLTQAGSDGNNGKQWEFKLTDNGKLSDVIGDDGIFTAELKESILPGTYDITLDVNGTTFKRSMKKRVKVYLDPAEVSLQENPGNLFSVAITPYKEIVELDSVSVKLTHQLPSGKSVQSDIARKNVSEWSTDIDTDGEAGTHSLILHIAGKSPTGKMIEHTLEKRSFTATSTHASPDSVPVEDTEIVQEQGLAQENDAPAGIDWMPVMAKVAIINVFMLAMAFLVYKLWPRVRDKIIPAPAGETVHG